MDGWVRFEPHLSSVSENTREELTSSKKQHQDGLSAQILNNLQIHSWRLLIVNAIPTQISTNTCSASILKRPLVFFASCFILSKISRTSRPFMCFPGLNMVCLGSGSPASNCGGRLWRRDIVILRHLRPHAPFRIVHAVRLPQLFAALPTQGTLFSSASNFSTSCCYV